MVSRAETIYKTKKSGKLVINSSPFLSENKAIAMENIKSGKEIKQGIDVNLIKTLAQTRAGSFNYNPNFFSVNSIHNPFIAPNVIATMKNPIVRNFFSNKISPNDSVFTILIKRIYSKIKRGSR